MSLYKVYMGHVLNEYFVPYFINVCFTLFHWINNLFFKVHINEKAVYVIKKCQMEFVYYIHQSVSRGTTTAHTTFTGERREGVHKQFIILVKCVHVIFIYHFNLGCVQCLRVELKDILCRDNPKHLYPFMQFLKNEGAINVLQFSLACGRLSIITEHHQIFVLKLLA